MPSDKRRRPGPFGPGDRGPGAVPRYEPSAIVRLAERVRAGDRAALARALTFLERRSPMAAEVLLDRAVRASGRAFRLGFTGPPGAGKSTLIAQVALRQRARGFKVGILAIDPSSPFTGGAFLGDRIRMGAVAGDPGVFVRSMATRGHHGGLAAPVVEAADLLELAGFDRILIETIGIGQTELDIAGAAHRVVVVLVPESGDAVQSLKAGPTEIGDVMVVNKADRPGADAMAAAVREALEIRASLERQAGPLLHELGGVSAGASEPVPVLLTEAASGRGVDELVDVLEAGAGAASVRGLDRRVRAIRAHLLGLVVEGAERIAGYELAADLDLEVTEVVNGRATPREAAARLLAALLGRGKKRRRPARPPRPRER